MYSELYASWQTFRQGKQNSAQIDIFEYNLENELHDLAKSIEKKRYIHGPYQKVIVYEKKRRDITIASVRDRIVHRYVYDRLVDIFDRSFDPDVWSCRRGKGLHKALNRSQQFLRAYPDSYVWRADITKFFDHVRHSVLLSCILCKVSDQQLQHLCQEIITSYTSSVSQSVSQSVSCGLPIGNLTSQVFSNIYLHEFDRFVRHVLKPQAYMRYGDDIVLFVSTRKKAYEIRLRAIAFLAENLGLYIHTRNDVIIPAESGLKFLGHVIMSKYCIVDKTTSKNVLKKISLTNLASYSSLKLAKTVHQQLRWLALDEVENLLDKNH